MKRVMRHFTTGWWHLRKALGPQHNQLLTSAVRSAEQGTSGEIRVVVETSLDLWPLMRGQSARERAIEVFKQEHVWDTEHNNGVLLYILLAERDAEIVADRGLNSKVSPHEWQTICAALEREVSHEGLARALSHAIERIGEILRRAFPAVHSGNELRDEVTIR